MMFSSTSNFYTGQWEEYHSHVMTTNFGGLVGVTESKFPPKYIAYFTFFLLVQFTNMLVIAINAFFGFPISTITFKEALPQTLLEPLILVASPFVTDS